MVTENYDVQEDQNRNGNGHGKAVFAGVVLGGVAGAITALLLAPQSGRETRSQIQNKVTNVRDRAGEKVEDTLGQIRSRADQLKAGVSNKAKELKHQGQEVLAGQLDRVSAAAEAAKKDIQSARS